MAAVVLVLRVEAAQAHLVLAEQPSLAFKGTPEGLARVTMGAPEAGRGLRVLLAVILLVLTDSILQ